MLIDRPGSSYNVYYGFPMSFQPLEGELQLVSQIFETVDLADHEFLPGDAAVNVFQGSRLDPLVLHQIWQIADTAKAGALSRLGTAAAVRLIGWAQSGTPISDLLLDKPGPAAHIEELCERVQSPWQQSPLPISMNLRSEDRAKYERLFYTSEPLDGLIDGDKAHVLLLKSGLPPEQLSAIWDLADTKTRGALDLQEFMIAMHLVQLSMAGQLTSVPSELPPELQILLEEPSSTPVESLPPLPPKPHSARVSPSSPPTNQPSCNGGSRPPSHSTTSSSSGPSSTSLSPPSQTIVADTSLLTVPSPTAPTASLNTEVSPRHGSSASPRLPSQTERNTLPRTTSSPILIPSPQANPLRTRSKSFSPSILPTPAATPVTSPDGSPSLADDKRFTPEVNQEITAEDQIIAKHYFEEMDNENMGLLQPHMAYTFLVQCGLSDDDCQKIWDHLGLGRDGNLTLGTFTFAITILRRKTGGCGFPKLKQMSTLASKQEPLNLNTPQLRDTESLSFYVSPGRSPAPIPTSPEQTSPEQDPPTNPDSLEMDSDVLDIQLSPRAKSKSRFSILGRDDERESRRRSTFRRSTTAGKLTRAPPPDRENDRLKRQVDDLMVRLAEQESMSSANERFRVEVVDLKSSLAQMNSGSATTELARKYKEVKREHERMNGIAETLREELMIMRNEAREGKDRSGSLLEEKDRLENQVKEMEDSMSRILATNDASFRQRLQEGNSRMSMRDMEHYVAQMQSSGPLADTSVNERIHADLTKENDELKKRLYEMEEMVAVLQSTQGDTGDIQTLIDDMTRENDRMKAELQSLGNSAEELQRLRARHSDLERENASLRERPRESSSNVPPPSYDDIDRA